MEKTSTYRYTRYRKSMLRIAVCDMLHLAGCDDYTESRNDQTELVLAEAEALGNVSIFLFRAEDWGLGTRLTVTVEHPCPGLSRAGEKRAADNMADRTLQLMEDTRRTENTDPPHTDKDKKTEGRNFLTRLFSHNWERGAAS